MSRQRRRRGRLRRGPSLASQAQAKPPFPVSLLFNVRAFYIIALVVMVTAVAAGAIMSQNIRRGGTGTQAPTATPAEDETETGIPPEGEPREVKTYDAEPEMTIDPGKQYLAVIRTEKGPIRIELFPDKAPQTVNNFVFLAREGFYDGLTFFFVRPDLVAQAGDPTCTADPGVTCIGDYGPGYTLSAETNEEGHVVGTVAMAEDTRTRNVHGSQFFIPLRDMPELDGRNIVFGRVIEGMDVVESLTPREWDDASAPPGDKILWVTIEET